MAVPAQRSAGELLREWRERRRLSQMDPALDAGVSARHLSFVDTMTSRVAPELLRPPVDVLRVSPHPDEMAPRIANLGGGAAGR